MDLDLPFYYHTATHSRFYEDDMPDFNQAPPKPKRPARIPVREMLGDNVERRITIAQRGAGSLRATFHNFPPQLPPASIEHALEGEHAYATRLP